MGAAGVSKPLRRGSGWPESAKSGQMPTFEVVAQRWNNRREASELIGKLNIFLLYLMHQYPNHQGF